MADDNERNIDDSEDIESLNIFDDLDEPDNFGDSDSFADLDFSELDSLGQNETDTNSSEEQFSDADMDELRKAFEGLESQMGMESISDGFDSLVNLGEDDMSEEDLDAMLKSLMEEEEQQEEEWTPRADIDEALEGEAEIYEGQYADQEIDLSVLHSDKKKFSVKEVAKKTLQQYKEGDKGTKALMLSIASIFVLTLASVITFAVMLFSGSEKEGPQTVFVISTPQAYTFNNASHTFIELTALAGEKSITLSRILLDEAATIFYFRDMLEQSRYIFTLEDFSGRIYNRDLNFTPNPTRDILLNQTVVRFEAMDHSVEGFTITVTDLETGISIPFEMTFDSDIFSPGRYIDLPIEVDTGLSIVEASIDRGIFSAAGTTIEFSMRYGMSGADLMFDSSHTAAPLTIRHLGSITAGVGELVTSHFTNDSLILGTMDFGPLLTLMGQVEISFGHMYLRHHLDETISANALTPRPRPNPEPAATIDLGDHIVNIHGFQRQGNRRAGIDLYVMTLHGLQKAYKEVEGELVEDFFRVSTTMKVNLVGLNLDGSEVRIPGNVRYNERGTDVLFDISANEDFANIPQSRLQVEIENISLRLPSFSASVNLDDLGFTAPAENTRLSRAIEDILTQNMRSFALQHSATQNVEYRAQVRQMHVDENIIHALVLERLAFTNNEGYQEVLRSSKITAELDRDGSVRIVSSEIVIPTGVQ